MRIWIHAAPSRVNLGGHIAPKASGWLLAEPNVLCFTSSDATWSIKLRMRLQIPGPSSESRCSVFSNNSQTVCGSLLDPMGCARQATGSAVAELQRQARIKAENHSNCMTPRRSRRHKLCRDGAEGCLARLAEARRRHSCKSKSKK